MRLAYATISERLFSRLEGLSAIARVEPGAKSSSPALPDRAYLYAMSLYSIAHRGSLHCILKDPVVQTALTAETPS
jgi:hypothetical protein